MKADRETLQLLATAYQAEFGQEYGAEEYLDWVAIQLGLCREGMNRSVVEMYAEQARRRAADFADIDRCRFDVDGRLLARDEHAGWCSHDTRRGCNCGLDESEASRAIRSKGRS